MNYERNIVGVSGRSVCNVEYKRQVRGDKQYIGRVFVDQG
jgi:hypothetical protein